MNAPLPAHALLRPEVRLEDALLAHGGTVLLSGTQALVRLPLMQRAADAARGLDSAGFVSGYSTTGQSDYVLRVLVSDIKTYERFLHDTMFRLPGVTHVRSSVVLREIKAQARLPVAVPAA